MKLKNIAVTASLVIAASAHACWNDSECPNDKICECPSTSPTGNCSSAGQCVPDGRDWKSLKNELLKANNSATITKLNTNEVKTTGNTIESITMKIQGRTGEPQPQYFKQQVKGNIVRIFDLKCTPDIWGTVNVSGVGTDIALVEVRASGYPGGQFSSTCTFQVMH